MKPLVSLTSHCIPSILSHWLGIFRNIVIITNIFTFSIIMNRWTCWCWTCHISIMAMYLQKKSVNGIWSCFVGKLCFCYFAGFRALIELNYDFCELFTCNFFYFTSFSFRTESSELLASVGMLHCIYGFWLCFML